MSGRTFDVIIAPPAGGQGAGGRMKRGERMRRWWGIRHCRFYWHRARVYRWAAMWGQAGIGLGIPNEADLQELMAIWDGQA